MKEVPLPDTKSKVKDLSELETQVLTFILATKVVGTGIPLYGATTVEVSQGFPNVKVSTLRYAVWSLRKKGLLEDRGIRRSLEKGKQGLVVWQAPIQKV